MLLFQVFIVLLAIFIGLILFMRYILANNISRATGHLQQLSKEYAAKQEEAQKRLQQAKEEAEKIVGDARKEASQAQEAVAKQVEEERARILEEAKQKGKEITEKAQRNYEYLQGEIERRIDEKAKETAATLIQQALPAAFLKDLHQRMMQESSGGEFQLKRLQIPEKVDKVTVSSAFALTDKERSDLKERLKKQIGNGVQLTEEVDASLVAGFLLKVGSVVIDATIKNRIEKAIHHAG